MDLNMSELFGKMQEMQQKMTEAQSNLASKTVTAEAGGGMVKVTANGALRLESIKVEPQVVDADDVELLEDLIMAGVNKALEEAAQMAQSEMRNTTNSFLPPGVDLGNLGL